MTRVVRRRLRVSYDPYVDRLSIGLDTGRALTGDEDEECGFWCFFPDDGMGNQDKLIKAEIDAWRYARLPDAVRIIHKISEKTGWDEKLLTQMVHDAYEPDKGVPAQGEE